MALTNLLRIIYPGSSKASLGTYCVAGGMMHKRSKPTHRNNPS